ncbi:hypothetical protein V5O48_010019 [Marasmius crinis-equi]|uniref:Uncharacterized protein n=1 Tax=Marasmius crinis-equi TaxID=585013 RepID=A0ABR3F9Q0_9AGAR
MAHNQDDEVPQQYKYAWDYDAPTMPLQDFLNKYKPSMVQNDGTKPWIWVESRRPHKSTSVEKEILAMAEASEVLQEVTKKVESADDSIPIRSNKKTGAKSKKEVREQLQSEATDKFKAIAQRYGYVNGKWLIFASQDKVDMIWSSLAKSLIEGPLAATDAYTTKVSTSPETDTPNFLHVICLYIPDVYDKESITEVMKVLLRHHGSTLSGVKSDLYTRLGIDSKHASGIQSTIWKNSALLKDTEAKALKDEFFKELQAAPKATDPPTTQATDDAAATAAKPKPKLVKKKKGNDDPFASDEDEDEPPAPKNKKRSKGDEDEDEPPKKKRGKK